MFPLSFVNLGSKTILTLPKYILTFFLIGILGNQLLAQDSVWTSIKQVESNLKLEKRVQKRLIRPFGRVKDSLGFVKLREEVEANMRTKGWAEFALDSFTIKNGVLHLDFHQGKAYFVEKVAVKGLNENTYLKAGFHKLEGKKAAFDWQEFQEKMAFCLNEYQNEGYPFARFDSLEMAYSPKGNRLLTEVNYRFHPGKLVRIDSVLVEGDVREGDELVHSMTGIYPGEVYNHSLVTNAPRILNSSIYFKNTKPLKVEYLAEDRVKLTVGLASRKAGKFDLLLGILPPRDDNTKLQITGLIDFQLVSPLFKAGEVLEFRFDKLTGSSQKMHLQYAHPYLFGSPMRIHTEFDLLKQDTTFLTRFLKGAVYYAFNPNLALKVYYKKKTSSLITTTRYELDTSKVPPVLDGKDQTYGLGFEFDNLDYRYSPRKGWRILADFGLGRKKVVRNPKLTENVYNGLMFNLPKREVDLQVAWFRAYSKRLVLMLANRTYWLDQEQYFQNDLLQVGGSRSIRGFNENQFFTDFYSMFTVENRFLLEQNSYIFVFSDYAYLENKSGTDKVLRPWGLGLGLTYETKAGMISVTYAVGKVKNFAFQPSRGRIHVGLINQF